MRITFQVAASPYDLRMLFGEMVEATAEKVAVERRAQVTASWLQARSLAIILSRAAKDREEKNGEVKLRTEC